MALPRPVDEAQREAVRALRTLHPQRNGVDVHWIDPAPHLHVRAAAGEVRREPQRRTPLRLDVLRRIKRSLRPRELLAASERPSEHRFVGVDQRHIRRGCGERRDEQCGHKCGDSCLHESGLLSVYAAILPKSRCARHHGARLFRQDKSDLSDNPAPTLG